MEETTQFEPIHLRTIQRKKPKDPEIWPKWIIGKYQPKGDIVEKEVTDTVEEVEEEVQTKKEKGVKAERFLELIKAGEAPNRAARLLNTTVRDLTQDEDVHYLLKDLIEKNAYPDVLRKAFYKAGIDEIFLKNVRKPKGHKTALAAYKLAAQDPNVGLIAPPQIAGQVNIDMTDIGKLLENMKPLAGLEKFIEVEESKPEVDNEDEG